MYLSQNPPKIIKVLASIIYFPQWYAILFCYVYVILFFLWEKDEEIMICAKYFRFYVRIYKRKRIGVFLIPDDFLVWRKKNPRFEQRLTKNKPNQNKEARKKILAWNKRANLVRKRKDSAHYLFSPFFTKKLYFLHLQYYLGPHPILLLLYS